MSAGLSYYEGAVARQLGRHAEADAQFREFARRIPIEFRPPLDEAPPDTELVP